MKVVVLFVLVGGGISLFALNWYTGAFESLLKEWQGEEGGIFHPQAVLEFSLEQMEAEVFVPPPLRAAQEPLDDTELSQEGIFVWTNAHRFSAGVSTLRRDALLDVVAKTKLQDMFERQYFAHIAPSGQGIGEVATAAGYEYIAMGENLALGWYESDEALVQAWMGSPGHRANILERKFQEIGIAAGQGVFEGETTWLAVQVFAKPLSACEVPDEAIKEEVAFQEIQLEELGIILAKERAALEGASQKHGAAWQKRVADYNELVARYNALVQETQSLIAVYNKQAQAFNACAA